MKKKILLSIAAIALSLSFLLPSASANRKWETAAVIAGTAILAGAVLSQAGNRVHYSWNYYPTQPPPPRCKVIYAPVHRQYYHPKWSHYPYFRNNKPHNYQKRGYGWHHR
ncbi:MAG TPA: hypothetical protein PK874_04810 [Desulfobacteraceae bacterium]|nr:hypothetical protein [Desulfobacteraceae bacterium]HPJ67603.1 hypothetical protein [Desulfobacteraceae bacterium]